MESQDEEQEDEEQEQDAEMDDGLDGAAQSLPDAMFSDSEEEDLESGEERTLRRPRQESTPFEGLEESDDRSPAKLMAKMKAESARKSILTSSQTKQKRLRESSINSPSRRYPNNNSRSVAVPSDRLAFDHNNKLIKTNAPQTNTHTLLKPSNRGVRERGFDSQSGFREGEDIFFDKDSTAAQTAKEKEKNKKKQDKKKLKKKQAQEDSRAAAALLASSATEEEEEEDASSITGKRSSGYAPLGSTPRKGLLGGSSSKGKGKSVDDTDVAATSSTPRRANSNQFPNLEMDVDMPDLDDGPPGVDPLDADPDSKSALFGEVGRAASGIASGSGLRGGQRGKSGNQSRRSAVFNRRGSFASEEPGARSPPVNPLKSNGREEDDSDLDLELGDDAFPRSRPGFESSRNMAASNRSQRTNLAASQSSRRRSDGASQSQRRDKELGRTGSRNELDDMSELDIDDLLDSGRDSDHGLTYDRRAPQASPRRLGVISMKHIAFNTRYATGGNMQGRTTWSEEETVALMEGLYWHANFKCEGETSTKPYADTKNDPDYAEALRRPNVVQMKDRARNVLRSLARSRNEVVSADWKKKSVLERAGRLTF